MKKITLYTDKYSHFGKMTARWLREHGFEFEAKDVAEKSNLDELVKLSEQYAIPVIVIGKEVIVGFNDKKLSEFLELGK